MLDSENVLSGLKSGVLTITLNHPKANAFTEEMIFSIQNIFKEAVRDAQVRCVLLIRSGNLFSAGHDLSEVFQVRNESTAVTWRGHSIL
jgi:enoyl-CoA hydratase/carnithine racemase